MLFPLIPEFFALLGVNIFLAISLVTCLLYRHFPQAIPYIYQVAAIVGFGHLLVSREFMFIFGNHMRFWYSFIYVIGALANVIAVNIYLGVSRRLWSLAEVFFGGFTFPTTLVFSFFVFGYVALITPSSSLFPEISMEFLCVALAGFTVVLWLCIFVCLRTEMLKKSLKKEVK